MSVIIFIIKQTGSQKIFNINLMKTNPHNYIPTLTFFPLIFIFDPYPTLYPPNNQKYDPTQWN